MKKILFSYIKNIYKIFLIYFFLLLYGKIIIKKKIDFKERLIVYKNYKKFYNFKLYKLLKARLYVDYSLNDVAYILDNILISGPSIQDRKNNICNIRNNITLTIGTPRLIKKFNFKILSALTGRGGKNNYFHWMFDVLPRILLIKNSNLFKFNKILLPSLKKKYQIESIRLLHLKEKTVIQSDANKHISSEEIYATSNINNNIEKISPFIINILKKNILAEIKEKQFSEKVEKIYIDRKDSNFNSNRLIINETEITSYLKSIGFAIIKLSEISFKNQIYFFNNAKYIIGLHGAGFSNLIFCKKNTRVIEIKPKKALKIYKNISKICHLNYNSIDLDPIKKSKDNNDGLIYCSLDKLKKYL